MTLSTLDRRTRKRLATRQKISDAATRLFIERSFDEVTIDEIATAADVARMTVFNHFARKEDMFFDLDEEARQDLMTALQQAEAGKSPIEALRLFAHWAVAEKRPYVSFGAPGGERFLATIRASEALMARARAIRGELTDTLTAAFTTGIKHPLQQPAASLAASLLVATWTVALTEAHRVYHRHKSVKRANAAFLALVDQGTRGVVAALKAVA